MPGEHSGGMIGQISSAPAPKPKRKAKPYGVIGAVTGGNIGHRVGTSKPKSSKSSGRSSGGGGGGGGGGGSYLTSTGTGGLGVAAEAPAPVIPGINDFLSGDDTYQSQVAAFTKALANYQSQMGERQGEYNQDFTRRLSDLNLNEQRSTTDQADDYAGRGIYLSGLYGKARGDLEQDFDNREGDMTLAKNQFLSGLNRDFTNFSEENNLDREKAKQDAISRRALRYGLT
jgi:hypothetical protein